MQKMRQGDWLQIDLGQYNLVSLRLGRHWRRSGIFIINFEHVITGWDIFRGLAKNLKNNMNKIFKS